MGTPLVSVILTSYNNDANLESTIKSVLEQDYPNIEIVAIECESNDGVIEVLTKYSDKVTWKSQKCKNKATALSKCFNWADGDIVVWLDAGDTLEQGAVSSAVKAFEGEKSLAIVYGDAMIQYYKDSSASSFKSEPFSLRRLASYNYIIPSSAFVSRKLYEDVGGINKELDHSFAYDLWVRLAKKYEVKYVEKVFSTHLSITVRKVLTPYDKLKMSGERLRTVMKNYRYAPPGRVFVYTYNLVAGKLGKIPLLRVLLLPIVFVVSFFSYLMLNKGIRFSDLGEFGYRSLKNTFNDGAYN